MAKQSKDKGPSKDPQVRARPKAKRGAVNRTDAPVKKASVGKTVKVLPDRPSLVSQIKDPGVWYTMTQGEIYIESPDSVIHQIDGKPVVQKMKGFILRCNGPKNTGGVTDRFYPDTNEKHHIQVEMIRAWMVEYPEQAAGANLVEHTGEGMAPPMPTWDTINATAAVRVIEDYSLNPLKCVQYELRNQNREDVIAAIEQYNIEQAEAEAAEAEAEAELGGEVDAVAL